MPNNMVNGFNINGTPVPYNYDSLGNKLEKTSIAREYSNIDTYDVDEYVIYNGRMYRCKQKILVGESFDSTKWDECSVGPELNYIKKFMTLSDAAKQALLNLLSHVAYTDEHGQDYLDDLEAELFRTVDLVSISAVFNQGQNIIYDTDSLDTLKQYLVVTATYDDSSTRTVPAANYTLSGALTEGTSTITVSYGGKTATFDVTVTHSLVPAGYTAYDYVRYTGTSKTTAVRDEFILTKKFDNVQNLKIDFDFMPKVAQEGGTAQLIGSADGNSGNNGKVAIYGRTDTKRISCFNRGVALALNDIPNMVVNTMCHITVNPNDNGKSSLTVDELSVSETWGGSYVSLNNEISYFGTVVPEALQSNTQTISNFVAIGILRLHDLTNVLVGEYTPCVRDADNVIGIYDAVEGVFHTAQTAKYATIGDADCVYAVGNWEV